jgi:hypothetical protein
MWGRVDTDVAEVFVACENGQLLRLGVRKDSRIFRASNANVVDMLREMSKRDEIRGKAARQIFIYKKSPVRWRRAATHALLTRHGINRLRRH